MEPASPLSRLVGGTSGDADIWRALAAEYCDQLDSVGRLRSLRTYSSSATVTEPAGGGADYVGAPLVNFASNDYLGLADDQRVRDAAAAALGQGAGAASSRLVTGNRPVHDQLEDALAQSAGAESALLFPSGYAANVGLLTALGTLARSTSGGIEVFSDELNHASIIDGCRVARAAVRVYRHLDLLDLDAQLAHRDSARLPVVVTDGVFSMDGDAAPLDELSSVCADHAALLVVDQAHAVFGPATPWSGRAEVVVVGTLSKSLGSQGGYVAASCQLIELCVNAARAQVFSTGLAPACAGAALAALQIVHSPEGVERLAHLESLVELLRPGHPSPIIPIVIGGDDDALAAAEQCRAAGLLVPAIRPPTVPAGTARLRVALTASHTVRQVEQLRDVVEQLTVLR